MNSDKEEEIENHTANSASTTTTTSTTTDCQSQKELEEDYEVNIVSTTTTSTATDSELEHEKTSHDIATTRSTTAEDCQTELEEIQKVFFEAKTIAGLKIKNQEEMRRLLKVGQVNEVPPHSTMLMDLFKNMTITQDLQALCSLLLMFVKPSVADMMEKTGIEPRDKIISSM
jgi:hypothetical protein